MDIEIEISDSLKTKRLAMLLASKEQQLKKASTKIGQLESYIDELCEQENIKEFINLRERIKNLEEELSNFKEKYKKLSDKHSCTVQGLYSMDSHYGTLQERIKKLQEENKKLKKINNDYISRILEFSK